MTASAAGRDRGSVLPLVMVFMVIGALIVVPVLTYASTILRANSVSVQKTEAMEQVRGGARVALADPADLFVRCSAGTTPIPVAASLVPGTSTTCREVERVTVIDQLEVPHGAVAMQLGEEVPEAFSHSRLAPAATDGTDWWGDPADSTSCTTWCPEPRTDTIWLPALPEVASSVQEASGYPMPPPRDCLVYFPGTYTAPIVLDGPTYFVSGVYYFEDTVTIVGGADVVMGFGVAEGCVGNDAAAVLDMYPNPLPPTLNSEGNGATLVFGDEGRLVIDDTVTTDAVGGIVPNSADAPLRFEVNQRYLQDVSDAAARVAIMSVNGDAEAAPGPPPVVGPLDVANVITMPESVVRTSTGDLVAASSRGLVPSSLTAKPRPPEPPAGVVVTPLDDPTGPGEGAARIRWDAPEGNDEGGSTITRYEVTAAPGPRSCETDGATACVIRDLDHDTEYTFTVTATNAIGESDPSVPVLATVPGSSPDLTRPAAPTDVVVSDPATFLDAAEVSWTPSVSDGNAPIVGYRVDAFRVYEDALGLAELTEPSPVGSCSTWSFRLDPPPTTCVVEALPALDITPGNGPLPLHTWLGYRFEVVAINAVTNVGLPTTPLDPGAVVGESDPAGTSTPIAAFTGTDGPVASPAPVWPVAPVYVPDPIVDVQLSGATSSTVAVDGYVAVPQGRVRVSNPAGRPVELIGGLVVGSFDVDDTTLAAMGTPTSPTKIGFEDVVLQRTVEIVTRGDDDRLTSTMRVQINANGADFRVNSWVVQ